MERFSSAVLSVCLLAAIVVGQPVNPYSLSGEQLLYTDEDMDAIELKLGLNGPQFPDWAIDQPIWALKIKSNSSRYFGQWICHQVYFEGRVSRKNIFGRTVPRQPLEPFSYKWCDCGNPGEKPLRNASAGEQIKGPPDASWKYEPAYSGEGIPNIYQIGGNELLGLIHKERVYTKETVDGVRIDRYYAIGIAYSTDIGMTWEYCGDIILPAYDSLGDFNINAGDCGILTVQNCIFCSNIGGIPCIVKNDSLYIYFNESASNTNWPYPSAAAACLDTVISHARQHQAFPGDWRKLSADLSFSNDPLTGTGARLPGIQLYPTPNSGQADLHSDATFCTVTGRYLLTVNETTFSTHIITSLKLYSSTDGITWTFEEFVAGPDSTSQPYYSSFVSEYDGSADDDHFVGKQFDILYVKRRNRNDMVTDLYYRHVDAVGSN